MTTPQFLTHYYEKSIGPFRSLTRLPVEQAETIQTKIRCQGLTFASRRTDDYLSIRRGLEEMVR